jgi:hypothetical protein
MHPDGKDSAPASLNLLPPVICDVNCGIKTWSGIALQKFNADAVNKQTSAKCQTVL